MQSSCLLLLDDKLKTLSHFANQTFQSNSDYEVFRNLCTYCIPFIKRTPFLQPLLDSWKKSLQDYHQQCKKAEKEVIGQVTYEGFKEGLSLEEIISRLAFGDAIKDLDNFDTRIIEKYAQGRSEYYQEEFKKISNVTAIDSGTLWEHSFNNESYQAIVRLKIDQYR